MSALAPVLRRPPLISSWLPFYYGWVNVLVAALAMVATLPGRTQGLGLITESLLKEFRMEPATYAQINLWATLLGSLACVGFGRLIDRLGNRVMMALTILLLGTVVVGMSQVTALWALAVAVTLTRAFGQSALSISSLSVAPQWFGRRLPMAMAVYSVALTVGFMAAFPGLGHVITQSGWRVAWSGMGWVLVLVVAPLAWALIRRSPEACGLEREPTLVPTAVDEAPDFTLRRALVTPYFWVFALASTLYGLVASGIGLFNESILAERGFEVSAYHQALAVTALTGLAGNFLGGWLATRWPLSRLLAGAMALLAAGLMALPFLKSQNDLWAQSVLMGLAGGLVAVLFFTVWGRTYGRRHLGQIQGAAQMLTVVGSAVGPLCLAAVVSRTGSYSAAFFGLAAVVGVVGIAALWIPIPRSNEMARKP
ncbi:MAG: MFS transporter [Verrucomicrobia bacterium]|nr:MFS transporter [Verrucomicrobiota bacterium]